MWPVAKQPFELPPLEKTLPGCWWGLKHPNQVFTCVPPRISDIPYPEQYNVNRGCINPGWLIRGYAVMPKSPNLFLKSYPAMINSRGGSESRVDIQRVPFASFARALSHWKCDWSSIRVESIWIWVEINEGLEETNQPNDIKSIGSRSWDPFRFLWHGVPHTIHWLNHEHWQFSGAYHVFQTQAVFNTLAQPGMLVGYQDFGMW